MIQKFELRSSTARGTKLQIQLCKGTINLPKEK